MNGICEQCGECITETDQCLCTHAIHSAPELECPWCGLDPGERADILAALDLGEEWEVSWLGYTSPKHTRGCGPVYGLTSGARSFGHCFGCGTDVPFESPR